MASPTPTTAAGPKGVLLLNEDDVRRLLTMDLALEAVEAGLRKMALDEAHIIPRARVVTDHAVLHTMGAAAKSLGYMAPRSTPPAARATPSSSSRCSTARPATSSRSSRPTIWARSAPGRRPASRRG